MYPTYRKEQDHYAVILAGGDGSRLMSLTRRITGRNTPKQFCPIISSSTLFEQTRRRVALGFSDERTVVVLNGKHRDFYDGQISNLPDSQLVIQPENRGTAPAVLLALFRLAKLNPRAVVTVFPSDHYIDDEQRFMSYVDIAMSVAALRSSQLVLLGIKPDRPEPGYGWIESAGPVRQGSEFLRVARFWEKPAKLLALRLWQRGCLWNSFVMAGTLEAFLAVTVRALPALRHAFEPIWAGFGTSNERAIIATVYADLPCSDFSKDILARFPRNLLMVPVEDLCWNDLGDPSRVHEAPSTRLKFDPTGSHGEPFRKEMV